MSDFSYISLWLLAVSCWLLARLSSYASPQIFLAGKPLVHVLKFILVVSTRGSSALPTANTSLVYVGDPIGKFSRSDFRHTDRRKFSNSRP